MPWNLGSGGNQKSVPVGRPRRVAASRGPPPTGDGAPQVRDRGAAGSRSAPRGSCRSRARSKCRHGGALGGGMPPTSTWKQGPTRFQNRARDSYVGRAIRNAPHAFDTLERIPSKENATASTSTPRCCCVLDRAPDRRGAGSRLLRRRDLPGQRYRLRERSLPTVCAYRSRVSVRRSASRAVGRAATSGRTRPTS